MKYLFVGLLLFSQSSTHCSAQVFSDIGIKLGVTSSNTLTYNNDIKYDPMDRKVSLNFSFFKDFQFSNNFIFSSEIGYLQNGFDYPYDEISVKVKTLSLSLLAKYIFEFEYVSPYLAAGPRIDYLFDVSSNVDYKNANEMPPQWDKYYKDFSFGVKVSIGVEYKLIAELILLTEIVYNYDLTNSYNDQSSSIFTEFINNSFNFNIGVKF